MDNSCPQESAPGHLDHTQSSHAESDEEHPDQRLPHAGPWTTENKNTMGQDMYQQQRPLLDRLSNTFGLQKDGQEFESYNSLTDLEASSATIVTAVPDYRQQDGEPVLAYRISEHLTYPFLGQLPLYLPESNMRASDGPFFQPPLPMTVPALPDAMNAPLSSELTQPLLPVQQAPPAWAFPETDISEVANGMQMPFCVEETSAWPSPVPSTPTSTALYTDFPVSSLPYPGWMEYPAAYPAGGSIALPFSVEAPDFEQSIKVGNDGMANEEASSALDLNDPLQRWAWQTEHTNPPDDCGQEPAFTMAERPAVEMPANYYPSPVADCSDGYEQEVQGSTDDKNDDQLLAASENVPQKTWSPVSVPSSVSPDPCLPEGGFASLANKLPILPQAKPRVRKPTILAPRPTPNSREEPPSDRTNWSIWDVPTDNEEESHMTRPVQVDVRPRPKRVRKPRARDGNSKRAKTRRNTASPPEKTRRTRNARGKRDYEKIE